MDIILNTIFNNPNLPVIQKPGIIDNFNRPAGVLTKTDDNKDWVQFGSAWATNGDGTASGSGEVLADGLASDGALTCVIEQINSNGGDSRCGAILRAVDRSNHLRVSVNTVGKLTLYTIVNGSSSEAITATGSDPKDGDILTAFLNGDKITLTLNGEVVLTHTTTAYMEETQYGLYSHSSNSARFSSIEFVAS